MCLDHTQQCSGLLLPPHSGITPAGTRGIIWESNPSKPHTRQMSYTPSPPLGFKTTKTWFLTITKWIYSRADLHIREFTFVNHYGSLQCSFKFESHWNISNTIVFEKSKDFLKKKWFSSYIWITLYFRIAPILANKTLEELKTHWCKSGRKDGLLGEWSARQAVSPARLFSLASGLICYSKHIRDRDHPEQRAGRRGS